MKSKKNHFRASRKPAMSSIGLAVITSLLASGAYAEVEPAVTPFQTVRSTVENMANVEALIEDGSASITTSGAQNTSVNTLNANTVRANAAGNSSTSSLDLALIRNSGTVDGQAVLNRLTNSGAITSQSLGNQLSIELNGVDGSTVLNTSNTGNLIGASATSNSAATSVAGVAPVGYASTLAGSSQLNSALGIAPAVAASGSIVVTTEQLTTGASRAVVNESLDGQDDGRSTYIATDIATATTGTVQGSVAVNANTIASTLKGNSATTLASIESGGANTFAGSAVVSNLQTFGALDVEGNFGPVQNFGALGFEGGFTQGMASTENASIGAYLIASEGSTTLVGGSMAVKNNTISASATANEALGNGAAGNRIVVGEGVAFTGSAGPVVNSLGFSASDTANTAADLSILNSQASIGSSLLSVSSGNSIEGYAGGLASASMDVSGNGITSSAKGNAASSAISLGGAASASVSASAVLANQQGNLNAGVSTINTFNAITAEAGLYDDAGVASSAMTVSGNRVSATAYGNEGAQSLALSANTVATGGQPVALTGGPLLDGLTATVTGASVSADGAATVTNLQRNANTPVSAVTAFSVISAEADTRGIAGNTIASSSLAVTNNTQEAVAVGSGANNALALSGNSVGAGAGISSLQYGDATSPVSATLQASGAGAIADTHVADGSLALTGNLQRAIGYGNSVVNSLAVTANASIVSALDVEGAYVPTSSVSFGQFNGGSLGLAFAGESQPQVSAATGVLNNQVMQASVTANASALNPYGYPANTVLVEGDLARSSATNNANAFIGAAYGNDATGTMALDLGNVSANAGVANVTNVQTVAGDKGAAITGIATGGTVVGTMIEDNVTSSIVSTSSNAIQALAVGNRATSQVSVQANNVQATSPSNGGSIGFFGGGGMTGAGSGFGFGADTGSAGFTLASFSAQNAQAAQGQILATQVAPSGDIDFAPTLAAGIALTVGNSEISGRSITDSTLRADGNRSIASATANSAATGVSVAATNLSASTAVQNLQVSSANVGAVIGQPGQAATEGTSGTSEVPFNFSVNGSGISGNFSGATGTISGTLTVQKSTLSPNEITALVQDGWVDNTFGGLTRDASSLGVVDVSVYIALLAPNGTATISGLIPETLGTPGNPATPHQGGVLLALRGAGLSVDGSTLSVSGNATTGSVTGNKASNSLSASAVNLDSGSEGGNSAMVLSAPFAMAGGFALADHALSNQQVTSGALSSSVAGSFAIDATEGTAIARSSLAVSGNSQSASVVANTASNSVALAGTNVAASAALLSQQSGTSTVHADSALALFAPVASASSSISLSDNKNTSQGVVNDVSNTLSVSGTNLATLSGGMPAMVGMLGGLNDFMGGLVGANADHVLMNQQMSGTGDYDRSFALPASVTSTASTQLYNQDQTSPVNAGLVDGSVTVSGNATTASAIVNRASNLVEVGGTGVMSANAGLFNLQTNNASAATASASTAASVSLAGIGLPEPTITSFAVLNTAPAALNQSSVALSGNSTTALAHGNSAVNALNATAGSVYSSPATQAGTGAGFGGAQATLAVLNAQMNSGAVTANSTASYQVAALSPAGLAVGATGSAVSVTGNKAVAEAVGNSATNAMTVSALTGSAPTAALGNNQYNVGNISANVTGVNYGVGISGGVTGSALRTSGNQMTATAIGNSAVSSIAAAAR